MTESPAEPLSLCSVYATGNGSNTIILVMGITCGWKTAIIGTIVALFALGVVMESLCVSDQSATRGVPSNP